MEKIRPIHIQEFQQFLVQECFVTNKGKIRPLSNNYIKQIFNKLRIIFKRAMVLEVIDENPVDTIGKIDLNDRLWHFGLLMNSRKYIIVHIAVISKKHFINE